MNSLRLNNLRLKYQIDYTTRMQTYKDYKIKVCGKDLISLVLKMQKNVHERIQKSFPVNIFYAIENSVDVNIKDFNLKKKKMVFAKIMGFNSLPNFILILVI